MYFTGPPSLVDNSIVAGNTGAGIILGLGGLLPTYTGVNLIDVDPMLQPLGDYGGPTQTMPPLTNSPAIDPAGGDTNSIFSTDQRGFTRVVNGILDIGAVEVQFAPSAPVTIGGAEVLGNGSFELSFTNQAGSSFQVVASTNAAIPSASWPIIGPAIEMPPGSGQFQFIDPDATNLPLRFYRVTSP